MKFISCDLLGPGDGKANFGLCNQMFQVAALYSHAKDFNLNITFPQIKLPSYGGYDKNIFSRINTEDIDQSTFLYLELPFGYHKLVSQDGITYRGYMQSEKYFSHNRSFILDLFAPTVEIGSYIKSKYKNILESNSLSIHIRRGDYVNLPDYHPLIGVEYYTEAANHITSKVPIDSYVIFSDDIEYCKKLFGDAKEITYIIGEEDYIDLYLMSFCKHNIITNSTFSWWGAWLNQNPDKIVVAPKQWFGPAKSTLDTRDLIPETWIKL